MPDDIEPLLDTNENFQPEQDNDGDDYLLNAIDDDSDLSNTPCCNPSHLCHRLIGLILMCLLGFGESIYTLIPCIFGIQPFRLNMC